MIGAGLASVGVIEGVPADEASEGVGPTDADTSSIIELRLGTVREDTGLSK